MSGSDTCILVVDDDPTLRELLVDTLITIGYDAFSTSGGREALSILAEKPCDLVISDIKMPEMDGIELLARLRKEHPDLPVLLITAVDSPEIIGRAAPDGFLNKPFRIAAIEELIERALKAKQQTPRSRGKKLLIVDDDDTFREMLTDSLDYVGFDPMPVASGAEALDLLEKGRFDAVVTDIRMPAMDGITLARRIRERQPNIPIIIMTAYLSRSKTEQDSGRLPTDKFIQKPFRMEVLIDMINDLVPA